MHITYMYMFPKIEYVHILKHIHILTKSPIFRFTWYRMKLCRIYKRFHVTLGYAKKFGDSILLF